ncbi:MAG TPA: phosphoribosyltransferase family protein, partial [Opitutaceae bacterium]
MLSITPYRDRAEAGQALARHLGRYAHRRDTIVLALPQGGVPVAFEVARHLSVPLDVFTVRQLMARDVPDLEVGAIASGGIRVLDRDVVDAGHLTPEEIDETTLEELLELERTETMYRQGRPAARLEGRIAILVDEGVADEFALRAALIALRHHLPAEIVVAVPVASPECCNGIATEADELVCPLRPSPFHAVGLWYSHFPPPTDEEVCTLLGAAPEPP